MVRKLEYRVELEAADRQAILALPFQAKTIERHHFIVRERELTAHCCLMLAGYTLRSKLTDSGGRQILAIQMKAN